jgi:hypothetical protein
MFGAQLDPEQRPTVRILHITVKKKKASDFPLHIRDVTNQTLPRPGRENR